MIPLSCGSDCQHRPNTADKFSMSNKQTKKPAAIISAETSCPLSPNEIASVFMNQFNQGETADPTCIDQLCTLAYNNQEVSGPALTALYVSIIEVLCDDFSRAGTELTAIVLARILTFVRATEEGRETDRLLKKFGFSKSSDLLQRYATLLIPQPIDQVARKKIKKILIPSRVTVGADVVITGILTHRLHRAFPEATIIQEGPDHLPQLFAELDRLTHVPLPYTRRGSIIDRITIWPHLQAIAEQEQQTLAHDQLLVVDSDSRLTQLGLLPLVKGNNTRLFPSRINLSGIELPSLPEMVNSWCDKVFGKDDYQWPTISLLEHHRRIAQHFIGNRDNIFLVVLSLGVGSNERKRIPDPFEEELIRALMELEDTVIIIDSGKQQCGVQRAEKLLKAAESASVPTTFLHENELAHRKLPFRHGAIGFQGSIGAMGALMQQAHGFFGYDSCCQHMAAALDKPSVIVFAGAPNDRFLSRWSSQGKKRQTRTIAVKTDTVYTPGRINSLVNETIEIFEQIHRNRQCTTD